MGSEITPSRAGRYAVLSIGTNSTRMVVADMRPPIPHVELARTIGTRVGEGLGERGELGEEPMARTLEALHECAQGARDRGAPCIAIATSALRRASNADTFLERAKEATGVPVRVLSGEEEAKTSFRGAVGSLPPFSGRTGVLDIGGGSTEYAVGIGERADSTHSFEIGAVRLTEKLPALAGKDAAIDGHVLAEAVRIAAETLAPMHEEFPVDRLLFVGGSATTTAAIADLPASREQELNRAILARVLERLCALDLEHRKQLAGMRPQRADILPAGIILLATAMELVGKRAAIVAPGDLLLGALLSQRDRGNHGPEPKEQA